MDFLIGLVMGGIIGTILGIAMVSLVVVGSMSDDRMEDYFDGKK